MKNILINIIIYKMSSMNNSYKKNNKETKYIFKICSVIINIYLIMKFIFTCFCIFIGAISLNAVFSYYMPTWCKSIESTDFLSIYTLCIFHSNNSEMNVATFIFNFIYLIPLQFLCFVFINILLFFMLIIILGMLLVLLLLINIPCFLIFSYICVDFLE